MRRQPILRRRTNPSKRKLFAAGRLGPSTRELEILRKQRDELLAVLRALCGPNGLCIDALPQARRVLASYGEGS